jgi:hypothetical protein
MSRLLWVSCAVLLAWVGNAELAWGQACRQPDATAELVRQDLARYSWASHPGDKAVRDSSRPATERTDQRCHLGVRVQEG